jgi:GNAT superfamily N-acetyltransferase
VITVRGIEPGDKEDWAALWRGYLSFYREELSEDTSASTFEHLCQGDAMFGLIALDGRRIVGLAHCVVHATTWSRQPTCYLEDLFVTPAARGRDAGRSLLLAVKQEAERRGASGVYWHTQSYNAPARSLYDVVGRPTSHVVYEM